MPSLSSLRVLVSAGLVSALLAFVPQVSAQSSGSASCPPGSPAKPIAQKDLPLILDKSSKGELDYWNGIKDTGEAPAYLAYIVNFPKGMFVDPAIEKFRARCGDINSIPSSLLVCQVGPEPVQDKCRSAKRISLLTKSPQIQVPDNPDAENELAYWNTIKESDDPNTYLVYINHFPKGMFFDVAVENYKRTCGDLSALPLIALSCQVGPPPAPPAPPKPPKPPKLKPVKPPPTVKPPPKPPKLRKPPKIVVNPCGGTTFASIVACSGPKPGTTTGTGNQGNSTGPTGTPPTQPGTPPTTNPPPKPTPTGPTTNTPVPVVPPVSPPPIT